MLQFDFVFSKVHILTLMAVLLCLSVLAAVVWYVNLQNKLQETGSDAAATLIDSDSTPYTDLAGNPFYFSELRGKVRVVNIWASWSPYSLDELAYLETIAQRYASADMAIVAINRKEPTHRIEAFLRQYEDELQNLRIVVDETDAFYKNVGGYAMPETLIYDQNGNLLEHVRGPLDSNTFETTLEELL